MTDIVHRLRGWRNLHLALGGELFEAAADEIERLRNGAVDARETVQQEPVAWANFYPDEEFVDFDRGCVEGCSDEGEVFPLYRVPQTCPHVRGTVTQHCLLNFTLTDAEREAILSSANLMIGSKPAAILRNLLARLA